MTFDDHTNQLGLGLGERSWIVITLSESTEPYIRNAEDLNNMCHGMLPYSTIQCERLAYVDS